MFELADLDRDATLEFVAAERRAAMEAEVNQLHAIGHWCDLHAVIDPTYAAGHHTGHVTTGADGAGTEVLIPLGGEGVPLVGEFGLPELAAVLHLSDSQVRSLVEDTLDLRHRLPLTWARVQALEVPVWRGRKIADRTRALSREAAAWVDAQVSPRAHKLSLARLLDTVDRAIAQFDPDEAARRAEAARDGRTVRIGAAEGDGTAYLAAHLDAPAAESLDKKVNQVATALGTLGDTRSRDIRRAAALGLLADPQAVLDLLSGTASELPRQRYDVTIHAHVRADDPTATVEQQTTQLVDTIAAWCGDASRLKVTPVIDLNAKITSVGYQPSSTLREQTLLKDEQCIFPFCTRDSRRHDHDHGKPYDPDGPPGQTTSDNQARLCRFHHRLKTHGRWRYQRVLDGAYLWTSPCQREYVVSDAGTTPLRDGPRHVETKRLSVA